MKGFRRDPDGVLRTGLSPIERHVLASLADQLTGLLQHPTPGDPALDRLLPDAYPDDPDSSAEFRRLTAAGLTERKLAGAHSLTTTLDAAADTGELALDATQAHAWLTTLTDLRLILAARLGITRDDDRGTDDTIQGIYDWLGWLQNALVEALDTTPGA